MADEKTNAQPRGKRFEIEQHGGLAVYGDEDRAALQHRVGVGGQVVHAGTSKQPLVHMVCWDEERPCECEIHGRVALVGDESAPLQVKMAHSFENAQRQELRVEPLEHRVATQLSDPIHHALQLRTPLQIRFCNPWHLASDYMLEIRMGDNRLISVRLTGATVATPQPCEDKPCPPVIAHPGHP